MCFILEEELIQLIKQCNEGGPTSGAKLVSISNLAATLPPPSP